MPLVIEQPDLTAHYVSGQFLKESGLDRGFLQSLCQWDQLSSNCVDLFLTNSRFIAKRIWWYYRREAAVISPPVDTQGFALPKGKDDFYFTAPPYKRTDVIVEAFSNMPKKPLIVIGDGPKLQPMGKKAVANVTLLGYQPFEILKDHLHRAWDLIFAAERDFGILALETQAFGAPVLLERGTMRRPTPKIKCLF